MIYSKTKTFSIEMGFTRKEFFTLLKRQDKLVYEYTGNTIHFLFAGKKAIVTLGEEAVRAIASAKLPMLQVSFDFSAMEKLEQEQFMKLFLFKFHKGGG